jgi:hypothetical protein
MPLATIPPVSGQMLADQNEHIRQHHASDRRLVRIVSAKELAETHRRVLEVLAAPCED